MIIFYINSHLQRKKNKDFQIPYNSIDTDSYIKPSDLHDKINLMISYLNMIVSVLF